MKYQWVSIGDKNSCGPCNNLNGKIFEEEDLPEGSEVCEGGDNCRCGAVPIDLIEDPEVEKVLDEVANEMMEGLVLDQTTGKRIILKYFEGVEGLGKLPYQTISDYESLVERYNQEIGVLPKKFYSLKDINKQIEFLEGELD